MARRYNTEEALQIIMDPDKEETGEQESGSDSYGSESESESGEEESAGWISKNGTPTNAETLRYVPAATGHTGPTFYAIARIIDPLSSFSLFLTDDIIQHIVSMTNLQGRRPIADWRDVDSDDLRAYVGLLILAGVYRSRNEATISLWSEKSGRVIFRATISEKRFRRITRAVRFDDRLARPRHSDDKLGPFRKIWDMWTHRLQMMFFPNKEICVDEQLVPFKGRCTFRQYMPKKPGRYGLKVWAVCDVETSYAWRLQLYTGKAAAGRAETNQGMRVVLELTEGLQGHSVTCDNFFTYFPLSEELLRRKNTLVGTIRKNKPELPPELLQTRGREVFSSVFAFTSTHTAVSYVPRRGKNVLLLSSKHRTPGICDGPKRKPHIIRNYNKSKRGVDKLDQAVSTYTCRRRTRRWPLALFHHLLDISLYNGYVLWTAVDPAWQRSKSYRGRLYIEQVGEALVQPHIARRERLPRSVHTAEFVRQAQAAASADAADPSPGPSAAIKPKMRKQCQLCPGKKSRVCTVCCKCGNGICKDHSLTICSNCST
ncbi:piggyBac transposable element-derived protein 4-like [Pelmatolapia mariae]|uniref:piggyBac transposable element-derived protein 4-like n=1 Tax=Pelmatolapia mariae TaxID=158779 RepID=UPI002FE5B217